MKCAEARQALKELGFTHVRTTASHERWEGFHDAKKWLVTLDCHRGEVSAKNVRSMIKQAGVSKSSWYKAAGY